VLEKIKAIPFVDESAAVKVTSVDGRIYLERTDKVIWAQEKTALRADGISCYVEAKSFFALFEDIAELSQSTCLKVKLKNGAEYELPFVAVRWDSVEMPTEYHDRILFKIEDLMLTTLRNLIKPDLQCIWIDNRGAVSCDIISACISDKVKSQHPFLLPLDVQELVVGKLAGVNASGDTLYIEGTDFSIAVKKPEVSDTWYDDLREMIKGDISFVPVGELAESMKRLKVFDDYVTFDGVKAIAGSNFEPFRFKDLGDSPYEIEKVMKILSVSTAIGELNSNLVLKNDGAMFLISAMEEA
jgi:hypothetical protein